MSILKPLLGFVEPVRSVLSNAADEKKKNTATGLSATSEVNLSSVQPHSVSYLDKSVVKSRSRYSAQEKWLIIREGELAGPQAVCARYGISIWSWRDWRKRRDYAIAQGDPLGISGLENRSGGRVAANVLSSETAAEILKEWRRCPGLGPSQIRNQLRRRGIRVSVKSARRVMLGEGYKPSRVKTQTEKPQRFEAQRPRELVQLDILQFYIHKQKVNLLLLLDDNSRFIVDWGLFTEANMDNVISVFTEMVRRYGKPESVLSDRAMVFYSWKGMNRFQKLLEEYEIDHLVASAHHPQTLGKIEAVNKNIQKELISRVEFSSLQDAQEKIAAWIEQYNYRRTHQGIGGVLVPADRFFGREQAVLAEINNCGGSDKPDAAVNTFYEHHLEDRQLNVLQITKQADEITLWVLGKRVTLS